MVNLESQLQSSVLGGITNPNYAKKSCEQCFVDRYLIFWIKYIQLFSWWGCHDWAASNIFLRRKKYVAWFPIQHFFFSWNLHLYLFFHECEEVLNNELSISQRVFTICCYYFSPPFLSEVTQYLEQYTMWYRQVFYYVNNLIFCKWVHIFYFISPGFALIIFFTIDILDNSVNFLISLLISSSVWRRL